MGCRMKRFVEGADRLLGVLFPKQLDDYIDEENPVRVIDVVVDELDLGELGFAGMRPAVTGRPAITPVPCLRFICLAASTTTAVIEY